MPVRDVLTYPDPFLKKAVPETDPRDPRLGAVFADLVDTLRTHHGGVGLAAPQIGEAVRAIVVDVTASPREGTRHGLLKLVNPRVTAATQWKKGREGCMSLPRLLGNIKRAQKIHVQATDETGAPVELDCEGYEAVAIQHETDHLDGILFPDRVKSSSDLTERRNTGAAEVQAAPGPAGVRAVLFDLDATLMDDAVAVGKAWTLLRERGEREGWGGDWDRVRVLHEPLAWRRWMEGENPECHDHPADILTRAWEDTLAQDFQPDFPPPRILAEAFLACLEASWELYEDVPYALDALLGRVKLGVVTNGGAWFQRRKFERLGLDRWFASLTVSETAGSTKPDAIIFLEACRSLGVEPSATVMVGDNPARDVEGARKAGLRALWLDREGKGTASFGASRITKLEGLGEAFAAQGWSFADDPRP